MAGLEPDSFDHASSPDRVKRTKSKGSGGSDNDWKKILSILAQSKYAKRVGVEIALGKYLEARSNSDINEAFSQIVSPYFWMRIMYPSRQGKVNAIIQKFV